MLLLQLNYLCASDLYVDDIPRSFLLVHCGEQSAGRRLAEVQRSLIRLDYFFGDTPLEPPQQMFTVAFKNDLNISILNCVD